MTLFTVKWRTVRWEAAMYHLNSVFDSPRGQHDYCWFMHFNTFSSPRNNARYKILHDSRLVTSDVWLSPALNISRHSPTSGLEHITNLPGLEHITRIVSPAFRINIWTSTLVKLCEYPQWQMIVLICCSLWILHFVSTRFSIGLRDFIPAEMWFEGMIEHKSDHSTVCATFVYVYVYYQ